MRRLIVGLCALLLAVMLPCVFGPTDAYAYGEDGMAEVQDSSTGGGGGAGSASYGDPDGPQANPKGGTPWRIQRGSTWRGAAVYGRANVGTRFGSLRDLIMGLRYYYLRF